MKNYILTLESLTPVYIGNGKEICKKDFFMEKGHIKIYDPIKLYSVLGKSYEEFLDNNFSCLSDFIKNNKSLFSAFKYKVELGDENIRKSDNINEFVKDQFSCPYIPGSSLKGAIRTAVLATKVKKPTNGNDDYYTYRTKDIKYNKIKEIEEKAFGKDKSDIFKYISISDSKPLATSDLIVCKKVDVFKDGNTNNKLNLCREALKPGTKITFDLSIDESKLSITEIMKCINAFSDQYRSEYISKFGNNRLYDNENIIYLGGGTGFLTKTVNLSLYGRDSLVKTSDFLKLKFKNHKHFKDKSIGVSPRAKKCTVIHKEIMEMGICKIRIEENETI